MTVKIVALAENDWQSLRAIRLKALKTDPGVFGSNHAWESEYDESKWRSWLSNPDMKIFGLFDNDTIIGMTGIALDSEDISRRQAWLWGSWLAPNYRGQGLSDIMYHARIDWAKNHETCEVIIVSHRASNISSKKANQKHGFVFTHAVNKTWPDGGTDDDIFYELRVNPLKLDKVSI